MLEFKNKNIPNIIKLSKSIKFNVPFKCFIIFLSFALQINSTLHFKIVHYLYPSETEEAASFSALAESSGSSRTNDKSLSNF